jgi:multiple sugar transport system substrate-binding protein
MAVALYKVFTPQVLSWDDASDNKYIDSGVGSFIINPISAYRSAQQINPALADKIFLWKCPKGPARRLIGAASNAYGIWKFAKNKEAGLEFLKYYAYNWVDAFKASTGYNMPIYANIVPKPMPILSNDPTSHPPTKLAVTETSDEWCAVAGWPGPAWAATDEVYNDFILCDMMTKAALGQMTPEEAVKWATNETKLIFQKWGVTTA